MSVCLARMMPRWSHPFQLHIRAGIATGPWSSRPSAGEIAMDGHASLEIRRVDSPGSELNCAACNAHTPPMSGVPLVDAGPELIEREQESAVLDGLVDRLRDGGGAIVVRGEAGIGKSALLQRVRRRAEAQGVRPLIAVGVESEAEFAFAGLHQLLRPGIGALAAVPQAQRATPEAAVVPGARPS